MTSEWEVCVLDEMYEICKSFPYQIRKIETGRIIKECVDTSSGYVVCSMNRKKYYKHRIIATQFIPNPNGYNVVDHINHDTTDYHIKNLRWCSQSENCKNRTSTKGVKYTLIESGKEPDDLIKVSRYNYHHFKDYYYSPRQNKFYFDNGVGIRELPVCYDRESAFVCATNLNDKQVKIFFTKFKNEFLD